MRLDKYLGTISHNPPGGLACVDLSIEGSHWTCAVPKLLSPPREPCNTYCKDFFVCNILLKIFFSPLLISLPHSVSLKQIDKKF